MAVQLAKVRLAPAGSGTVELDGQRIPGVRSVTVRTEPGCLPTLVLEIITREVDLTQGPAPVEEVSNASTDG